MAAGDTLASLAKSVYGDSTLWYLIADANGLGGERDLRVGQTLTVPSRVTGARNNSHSFKPYNPGEVVGNTTPNLPSPPSGGGGGCGGLGVIIMVAVAVAVTVYTGGAAATALNSQVLGYAAAAAAGSIASQAVGNVLGIQNGFDWNAVALAALSGGVTAGVGEAANGMLASQNAAGAAARAALSNALTQGIAVASGLQPHFSWASVAASAVGAGVGHGVNGALAGGNGAAPAFNDWGDSAGRIARASVGSFAAGVATAVARGGRVEVTQIATDAFGNALGSSVGEEMVAEVAFDRISAQFDAMEDAGRNGVAFRTDRFGNVVELPGQLAETLGVPGPGDLPVEEPQLATSAAKTVRFGKGQTLTQIAGTNDPDILDKIAQYNGLRSRHEVPAGATLTIPDAATLANLEVSPGVAERGAAGAKNYAQRQVASDLAAQRSYLNRNDAQLRAWVDEQFAEGSRLTSAAMETVVGGVPPNEASLLNEDNLIKPSSRSAYRTDSGYRDSQSGRYTTSPIKDQGRAFQAGAESEYTLIGGDGSKVTGSLPGMGPIDNGNYLGPRAYGDYLGEAKVVLAASKGLISDSLDAKAGAGVRAGVRYAQGAAEGRTEVLGATFGVKAEGNVSTSAAVDVEGKASFKPGGASGVTIDVGLSGNAYAALVSAQGKAEFPVTIGPLTLKPSVQVEGQGGAFGVSGGVGFKTYETRTGGSMYVGGGAAALFGAKVKLGLDWQRGN